MTGVTAGSATCKDESRTSIKTAGVTAGTATLKEADRERIAGGVTGGSAAADPKEREDLEKKEGDVSEETPPE